MFCFGWFLHTFGGRKDRVELLNALHRQTSVSAIYKVLFILIINLMYMYMIRVYKQLNLIHDLYQIQNRQQIHLDI